MTGQLYEWRVETSVGMLPWIELEEETGVEFGDDGRVGWPVFKVDWVGVNSEDSGDVDILSDFEAGGVELGNPIGDEDVKKTVRQVVSDVVSHP